MGGDLYSKSSRKKKRLSTSSSSSSSDSENSEKRSSRHRGRKHKKIRGSRRENENEEKYRKRKGRRDERERKRRDRKSRSRRGSKREVQDSDSCSSDDDDSEPESPEPEAVVCHILERFPNVADDLQQLLQMIDDGQAVDTRGISSRSLVKLLKKLFLSLDLEQNDVGVFLLPPKTRPTLEVVGSVLFSHLRPKEDLFCEPLRDEMQSSPEDIECRKNPDEADVAKLMGPHVKDESSVPKRRVIGPEMPSSELLAAAAKLTEAETELREAELEVDNEFFIGPPPPALVAEAASANDAERFEEVTRIMGAEVGNHYDVVGVNHNMSIDNIKKRYWKLSLMVHPDKCSHPQAHQAFVILNQAFKELQDPDKRKIMDEKIRLKEEKEAFQAELKAHREAAQWRRLQGISMEGDDELLAEIKLPQKRDDWMTTLPPERKPGVSMQSRTFSKGTKEGRGDTSVWTDSPLDKAQKAKTNYLEAYNKATAIAAEEKKGPSSDAELVDKYNHSKRSVSLVQKHQEHSTSRRRKKSKQPEKEEWADKHPWKPWDREKDLTAGRQKVNLDSDGMAQGLASRFSSGDIQRNFL